MDNVEILRRGYEAFGRGEIPAVLALLDPAIEWTIPDGAPAEYAGPHSGHEGVVAGVFTKLGVAWRAFEVHPERFLDAGDHVVAIGEYRVVSPNGDGRGSVPFAHVWTMRDGRALAFRDYSDTALARDIREGVLSTP